MANTLEELEIIVKANTEEATAKLKELRGEIEKKLGSGLKDAGSQLENTQKKLQSASGEMQRSIAPLFKLSNIFKVSVFATALKFFEKLAIESLKGIKDLAQYSYNFNQSMSNIKSSLLETRNAITASYAPVIQALEPIITSLTNALFNLFNALARVNTILFTNKTSFVKAKKVTVDYAKSLNNAGKEAKGMLASFDELNVISKQNGTDNGMPSPAEMFETEEIDPSKLEGFSKFIYDLKQDLKEIDFSKLVDSFERLKKAIEPFKKSFFDGLYWFKDNILIPFMGWNIEEAIPAFFDLLTACLKVLKPILEKTNPLLGLLFSEFLVPVAKWTGGILVDFLIGLTDILEKLADFLEGNTSFAEFLDQLNTGEKIAVLLTIAVSALGVAIVLITNPVILFMLAVIALIGAIETLHSRWTEIKMLFSDNEFITNILNMIEGLWDTMEGFGKFLVGVFTGDWEQAWEGIQQHFTGVLNMILSVIEDFINHFVFMINGLLQSINLSIEILNTVPGVDIKKIKLLNAVQIPRLAKGAVLKQSTLFEGGEYIGASSNPEIVSPQSLMYETNMKANVPVINSIEEMADRIIIALQDLGVYAEFDYDKMRVGINREQERVGKKFYGGAYV